MQELMIPLDSRQKVPLYQQIYRHIREEIGEGRIAPGEKLPSTRLLAANLGVSRSTVDLAYEQLYAEGFITSRPYRGYFACDIEGLYRQPRPERREAAAGEPRREAPEFDFALNGIDRDGFPYNTWKKLSRQVLAEDPDGELFSLGDPRGDAGLRREIVSYLSHARGVNCQPDQVIVGAGNDYLLLLLHVILGPGRKVAMDNPTYPSAWLDFEKVGYEMCPILPDDRGMQARQLEACGADLAYVMPSHHFPLGTVMPIQRRMQLLAWAAGGNRFLIEDDYDSEFRYKGKPVPSLQGYDTAGRVIYLGTFSKSLAPAIRVSYMVLPPVLLETYRQRASNFSATVSRVDQKILELFLRDGYFERHLNRMRGIYRGKHDCLLNCMKGKPGIRIRGENAGVHLLVSLENGLSEGEAIRRAAAVGVRVYGLSEYCVEGYVPDGPPTLLLGYATLKEEEIMEAARRLEKVWEIDR